MRLRISKYAVLRIRRRASHLFGSQLFYCFPACSVGNLSRKTISFLYVKTKALSSQPVLHIPPFSSPTYHHCGRLSWRTWQDSTWTSSLYHTWNEVLHGPTSSPRICCTSSKYSSSAKTSGGIPCSTEQGMRHYGKTRPKAMSSLTNWDLYIEFICPLVKGFESQSKKPFGLDCSPTKKIKWLCKGHDFCEVEHLSSKQFFHH